MVRKIKYPDVDLIETKPLFDGEIASIEQSISGYLGLMPFYDISEIPEDAVWSREADGGLKTTFTGNEVYDLMWSKYDDSVVFKWRFFVDPKTKLPQQTEFYEKLPADSEFTLTSVIVVEYLEDSETQAIVKEFGF